MHEKAKCVCFIYMQPQKVKFKYVQINMKHVSYNLNELGHMQEQSLLYFYMISKLQRVGYHGNRLHSVKQNILKFAHYGHGGEII